MNDYICWTLISILSITLILSLLNEREKGEKRGGDDPFSDLSSLCDFNDLLSRFLFVLSVGKHSPLKKEDYKNMSSYYEQLYLSHKTLKEINKKLEHEMSQISYKDLLNPDEESSLS